MKKINIILGIACVAVAGLVFTACGEKETPVNPPASTDVTASSDQITETPESNNKETTELTEEILKNLVKENDYLFRNVFVLDCVPISETDENGNPYGDIDYNDPESYIRKAKSEPFADYAALEEKVKSIYDSETAKLYLENYPQEGNPMYINRDGALYVNLSVCGSKGYYVNWDDVKIEILSVDGDEATVRFTAQEEVPAAEPTFEDHVVGTMVVLEKDGWKLTRMLY